MKRIGTYGAVGGDSESFGIVLTIYLLLRTPFSFADIFGNRLEEDIPNSITSLSNLQILHLKLNRLSGTIPDLGSMPKLQWIDLSSNYLHGTVPQSLGTSKTIKDLRLGNNRLYDPIPSGLCSNPDVNAGVTKKYGCAGILCPIGTYSEVGHAVDPVGCFKCPAGESTLYLGSVRSKCQVFTEAMILTMFFEVMQGHEWPLGLQENWGNYDVPLCKWAGLTCDEDGELESIAFPLVGLEHY